MQKEDRRKIEGTADKAWVPAAQSVLNKCLLNEWATAIMNGLQGERSAGDRVRMCLGRSTPTLPPHPSSTWFSLLPASRASKGIRVSFQRFCLFLVFPGADSDLLIARSKSGPVWLALHTYLQQIHDFAHIYIDIFSEQVIWIIRH